MQPKAKMTWNEVEQKLASGRPSARKIEFHKEGKFFAEYLPTIGGLWVKAEAGDRFPSRAEAINAAKAVKAHWLRTSQIPATSA